MKLVLVIFISTKVHLFFPLFLTRRLRDKLLEQERFELAKEVTSKCALDPVPVWFSLGISQLKSGKLSKARDALGKCMSVCS